MRRTRSERASKLFVPQAAAPARPRRHIQPLLQLQALAGNDVVNRLIDGHGAQPAGPEPVEAAPVPAPSEEEALAAAFRSSTFYYGTTGGDSALSKAADNLRLHLVRLRISKKTGGPAPSLEDLRKTEKATKSKSKEARTYFAGERFKAFHGQRGDEVAGPAQMMDLYYGEEGTRMHEMRNPAIGKYVHKEMGYEGEYDQAKSGRETYMEKYSKAEEGRAGREGWQKDEPGAPAAMFGKDKTLTGTMEISRIIRDGIQRYGGTLVFEGKYVTNEGNFVPGARTGDTNIEAQALFPLFAAQPGASRVPFGNGTLVFHWGGKEQPPTQLLFTQNWLYKKAFEVSQLRAVPSDNMFWKFPGPYTSHAMVEWELFTAERVMDYQTWIKKPDRKPFLELQKIDRPLRQFELAREALAKAPVPDEAEMKKFDACINELLRVIDAWKAQKRGETPVLKKWTPIVTELGSQVSSCQKHWERFRAAK